VQAPWGLVLQCTALSGIAPHFFTARTSPVLASGNGASDWNAVAAHIGVPTDHLFRFDQVHGSRVERIAPGKVVSSSPPARADAGVTTRSDAALCVKVADCVPILLADRRGRGVAAVHAGWRGAAAGIVDEAVRALGEETGARPVDLIAAVGPSIGLCCYEVGDDVKAAFNSASPPSAELFTPQAGKWRLDLWQAVRGQLESCGVPSDAIHVSALCTATHLDWFFSYRRQRSGVGRMLGVIRRR